MSILKCNQTVNEAITHVDSCMRDIDLFLCFLNEVFFLSNCSHLSQLWFYADWHASIFCWHRVISVNCQPHPALAKIASKRSDVCLNNLVKTQVQITSLQKLATACSRYLSKRGILANRYVKNWCVTNFPTKKSFSRHDM